MWESTRCAGSAILFRHLRLRAPAKSVPGSFRVSLRPEFAAFPRQTADTDRSTAIAEIREENPEADEREVRLRVAIRESIGMTRDEEDATYGRIAAAVQGGAA